MKLWDDYALIRMSSRCILHYKCVLLRTVQLPLDTYVLQYVAAFLSSTSMWNVTADRNHLVTGHKQTRKRQQLLKHYICKGSWDGSRDGRWNLGDKEEANISSNLLGNVCKVNLSFMQFLRLAAIVGYQDYDSGSIHAKSQKGNGSRLPEPSPDL